MVQHRTTDIATYILNWPRGRLGDFFYNTEYTINNEFIPKKKYYKKNILD